MGKMLDPNQWDKQVFYNAKSSGSTSRKYLCDDAVEYQWDTDSKGETIDCLLAIQHDFPDTRTQAAFAGGQRISQLRMRFHVIGGLAILIGKRLGTMLG